MATATTTLLRAALAALAAAASVAPAAAWWGVPHMVTAEVASRHLSAVGARRAEAVLLEMRRWYDDTSEFTPAAVWADDIKEHGVRAFNSWHYVDVPFVSRDHPPPDAVRERLADPDAVLGGRPPENSVVWAMEQARGVLESEGATSWARSLFLRLLIHYTGDLHQPLHAAAYYSAGCPRGDYGGNEVCVLRASDGGKKVWNLHAVLDSGAGYFPDAPQRDAVPGGDNHGYMDTWLRTPDGRRWLAGQADRVLADHPIDSFDESELWPFDPQAWARESYNAAATDLYPRLEAAHGDGLTCSRHSCHNETADRPLAVQMDAAFEADLARLAARRVALGGYRLARAASAFLESHAPPAGEGEGLDHASGRTHQIWLVLASIFITLTLVLAGVLAMLLLARRRESAFRRRAAFQELNEAAAPSSASGAENAFERL